MISRKRPYRWRWIGILALGACAAMGLTLADAQTEQRVEVRIHDFTFICESGSADVERSRCHHYSQ